jgi:hypothetical protein
MNPKQMMFVVLFAAGGLMLAGLPPANAPLLSNTTQP